MKIKIEPEDSRDIVAALPKQFMQFIEYRDCGHGVWRDDPNMVFPRIREFILEDQLGFKIKAFQN